MNNLKEYAVIVKNIKDLDSLYNDMENSGYGTYEHCPHRSVNCSCRKPSSRVTYYHITQDEAEHLKNDPRIETVVLSMQEQDISVVLNIDSYSKLPHPASPRTSKNWGLVYSSTNGDISNWNYTPGITRTTYFEDDQITITGIIDRGGWETSIPTNQIPTVEANIDFDYNAMGENIDIVIMDEGIEFNHPEFAVNADGTGGSRCVPYNWFQHDLEVKGTTPTGTYIYSTDFVGDHGTHVAGIAAGNTHGWARKANIYSFNIFDDQIEPIYWFDYIKAFHNSKMNSRPTIINCSFGFNGYIGQVICDHPSCLYPSDSPYALSHPVFSGEITDILYQNTYYNGRFIYSAVQSNPTPVSWEDGVPVFGSKLCCDDAEISPIDCLTKGSTVCPGNEGTAVTNGTISFDDIGYNTRSLFALEDLEQYPDDTIAVGFKKYIDEISIPEIDADVKDLESVGVVVVAAAGNRHRYIAASGDVNYNNKLIVNSGAHGTEYYYMRRNSPATENSILVGSLSHENFSSNRDPKQKPSTSVFSNRGPGVDIWAPGENIVSSVATMPDYYGQPFVRTDPRNSNFYLDIKSGTSMAAPQVVGVLACMMSTDPKINAGNAKEKLLAYGRKNDIYYGFESQSTKPIGVGPNFTQLLNPLNSGIILLNPYTTASIISPITTKDVLHQISTEPKTTNIGNSKNGTVIAGCSQGGKYSTRNNSIIYKNINSTINLFDNRFDDPGYYYSFPNSQQAPNPTPPTSVSNSANFYGGCFTWGVDGTFGNPTTVGTNGGPSYYGTFDQTGNVHEWTTGGQFILSFVFRGGSWQSLYHNLSSTYRRQTYGNNERNDLGFRVASSSNVLALNNFVTIGNAGNSNDITGFGAVGYTYQIGKYAVTNSEYAEFLNSIAQNDTFQVNWNDVSRVGILRQGNPGSYNYVIKNNMCNKPMVGLTWFDAARYCNWLHNGKPTGPQNNSTTEDGAYTLAGRTFGNVVAKNSIAKYYIPGENEWYKAAYYSPIKNGVNSPGYYLYATQSDICPTCVFTNNTGDGISRNDPYSYECLD
jgi:hypothetical protein